MFVIIPVPYEATTTYGKGTKNGPAAILKAMDQVEDFDEELGFVTNQKARIKILKPLTLKNLPAKVQGLLPDKNVPIILGGEHSITPHAVKACAEAYNDLSVLQFDAHADLRDSYHGSKQNHACAARRILEVCPLVQVGVRNISKEGYEFAKETGQLNKIHWANHKNKSPHLNVGNLINSQLSKNVYITIDVDVFDPSVVPAVGTPEPGGLLWCEVLDILKAVCAAKNVVGVDVVELSPRKGEIVSDFAVAKLVDKLIGYLSQRT